MTNYYAEPLAGEGPAAQWEGAVGFDIELLLLDERQERPCQFSLREVGGKRRLDCAIGICEAAALQRELERLATPRPLTHRAMVSLMAALGGCLERVVVDRLHPEQRIYEAKLHIRQATEAAVVDVRVSDAVILAVICEVPLFVSHEVLARLKE